jgi:hypothetical protein
MLTTMMIAAALPSPLPMYPENRDRYRHNSETNLNGSLHFLSGSHRSDCARRGYGDSALRRRLDSHSDNLSYLLV